MIPRNLPTPWVTWTTKSPGLRSAISAAKAAAARLFNAGSAIRSEVSNRSSVPMMASFAAVSVVPRVMRPRASIMLAELPKSRARSAWNGETVSVLDRAS